MTWQDEAMKWEIWLVHSKHDKNKCVARFGSEIDAESWIKDHPIEEVDEEAPEYRVIKIWE